MTDKISQDSGTLEVLRKNINGKHMRIEYQESADPTGENLIRYNAFVDNEPYPLKCEISKGILKMIQMTREENIYKIIPDCMAELIKISLQKQQ